jgi:hypothetical protein
MSLLESFAGALESIGKLVEHPAAAKGTLSQRFDWWFCFK